ncbi:cupin domain-containing protein [Streptomyces phaeochromogenes]|uniref:JmjC domain-containing protein n=1 Tax=Streptomyces phaeochromogenes TaxID=1923 RepID=UPI00225B2758|nr:cupin domain-containing protein [Streptomyces phaeochromogenes]MCX5605539.1 cupin domain-containing protein [Streptomyces phaeochromogenes]
MVRLFVRAWVAEGAVLECGVQDVDAAVHEVDEGCGMTFSRRASAVFAAATATCDRMPPHLRNMALLPCSIPGAIFRHVTQGEEVDVTGLADLLLSDHFRSEILGKRVTHIPGFKERTGDLFGWRDLDDALSTHRFTHPRLRLSKDGRIIPPENYATKVDPETGSLHLSPADLYRELRGGSMLVLDEVEDFHSRVRAVVRMLQRGLGERVVVNAYASLVETEGFDLHWDDHDVIVLHITGAKLWKIYGVARQWPMRRDRIPNSIPPDREPQFIEVSAGDILHVPRGHWHHVRAVETPSLHLTIGVTRPTGHDFLAWSVDQLLDEERVRQDLPRYQQEKEKEEYLELLKEKLLERIDLAGLQEYLRHRDAVADPERHVNLEAGVLTSLEQLSPSCRLRWLAPRARVSRVADGVQLLAAGSVWTFADPAGEILDYLLSSPAPSLRDVYSALDSQTALDVVASFALELCRAGLLTIDPSVTAHAELD